MEIKKLIYDDNSKKSSPILFIKKILKINIDAF